MFNYVEDFASPQVGRTHETETGLKLLISARLMERDLPYNVITHFETDVPGSMKSKKGTLLLEAMDIEDLEAGVIGHCLFKVKKKMLVTREAVATYSYRCNGVVSLLLHLASVLTDRPILRQT